MNKARPVSVPTPEGTHTQVVPFHDCDPLNIVWHGNYYKYLEIARENLMRSLRLDVPDLIEMGLAMVVIESRCRYSFPLRFGDTFTVSARLRDWEQRLQFTYEIRNQSHGDRRVARAWTTLVAMREGEMLLATPAEVVERIEARP